MPKLGRKQKIIASMAVAMALAAYAAMASSSSFSFAMEQKQPASDMLLESIIPSANAASVDYFLKIDGIEGESTNARHVGEIDVGSYSWSTSSINAGPTIAAKGAGAGKVSFSDIHFTKNTDKSSPKLMLAAATGQHIKQATLTAEISGEKGQQFLQIKLTDVTVSSYQQAANSGEAPTDSFSLSFAKIEFTYNPVNSDGSSGGAVTGGWDVKANNKA
ncbi:MAG TPA: type VI secretion system tube protein Hcp [Nitrososphaera sp.]|nr:type VI secretion system tube protein Hcp [Nitrososphaera sp.]